MRALAPLLFVVACARPRPAAPIDVPPADAVMAAEPAPVDTVRRPVDPAQIAALRGLVAQTTGVEQLEVRARLVEALAAAPDPATRAEAIALAAALVDEPGFATLIQADGILYQYAAGSPAGPARVAIAQRLVREFPRSPLVNDARLLIGDDAFADGDLIAARAQYDLIVAAAPDDRGDYARYKRAWVAYNLGERAAAHADFRAVARTAREPLRREAIRDLTRVLADDGTAASAWRELGSLDPDHVVANLLRLAELYWDIGKGAEARATLGRVRPMLAPGDHCRADTLDAQIALTLGDRAAATDLLAALVGPGLDPACADGAALLATDLALATSRQRAHATDDPTAAIAAWAMVRALAPTATRQRDAARAGETLAAEYATATETAAAWLVAADASYQVAVLGDRAAIARARARWVRVRDLDPGLAAEAEAGLRLLTALDASP